MTAKQRCDVTRTPSVQRRAEWRRVIAVLAILFVAALASSAAQSLPLVAFEWDPAAQDVLPGTTQVSVDLVARQSEDADAAGLTLGFTVSGVVTGVALGSFGAAVSASDGAIAACGGIPKCAASTRRLALPKKSRHRAMDKFERWSPLAVTPCFRHRIPLHLMPHCASSNSW